jgi:hypothetical protein
MEETKCLKPSDSGSRIGDRASVQAATRVNAEQASKRSMCRPTRRPLPMGMRAPVSRDMLLQDVFVPDDAEVLPPGLFGTMYNAFPHLFLSFSATGFAERGE